MVRERAGEKENCGGEGGGGSEGKIRIIFVCIFTEKD